MLNYNFYLKPNARQLRSNATDCERLLWIKLRRKQLCDIQFYRQKTIGNYIVDFYAPRVRLVIELDGSQHFEKEHLAYDLRRDLYLKKQGLMVMRFNNQQVLQETDGVMETIYQFIVKQITEIPLNPPFLKGERIENQPCSF